MERIIVVIQSKASFEGEKELQSGRVDVTQWKFIIDIWPRDKLNPVEENAELIVYLVP